MFQTHPKIWDVYRNDTFPRRYLDRRPFISLTFMSFGLFCFAGFRNGDRKINGDGKCVTFFSNGDTFDMKAVLKKSEASFIWILLLNL